MADLWGLFFYAVQKSQTHALSSNNLNNWEVLTFNGNVSFNH